MPAPVGAEAQLKNLDTDFELHVRKSHQGDGAGAGQWVVHYGPCGAQSNPYYFDDWGDTIYNIRFALKTDPNSAGYSAQSGACGGLGPPILFEKWSGKGGMQEWLEDNIR